jgi:hypothetical protein
MVQTGSFYRWIPLVGIALVLIALAFSPAAHAPGRIALVLVGIAILIARAAFLFRKTRM